VINQESIQAWTAVGTLLGVVLVAIRTELRGKAALAEHATTQKAVADVAATVNGPLGESLRATAAALTHVAHLTGIDTDILAAVAARKRAAEHLKQAAEIEAFKTERAAMFPPPPSKPQTKTKTSP